MTGDALLRDILRRHDPVRMVTRGLFGSDYWQCPVDGARSARDVAKPTALCDATRAAIAALTPAIHPEAALADILDPEGTYPDAPTPEPRGLREALDAIEDMANDRDYDRITATAAAGVLRAALAATESPDTRALDVEQAAIALLIAVDNAALEALVDAEDGAEVPDWQERLWDAADTARAVLTP